ncbi:MAG TPA: choice-of-anchor D domain-containing protein [Candidatus Kapabacteria bacterium]|nr:choice-of-anchor D domain-containing protein [Candidatus Kapabacteria bacterium]
MLRHARTLVCAFLAVLTFGLTDTALAQWSIRATTGAAHFVKLLDEVGQPHIGFVGLTSGGMLRTDDTGHTWTEATFEADIKDQIYDITFKNGLTGFAVGEYYSYKTMDGGVTWSIMAAIQGHAIHYASSTGMLFITTWSQQPSQASTDEGVSWYSFASAEMNGFTAIDAQRMMFTPHAGQGKFTTDGGANWESCNMTTEVYQPTALKNRGWYVGVSEVTHGVYRTTDGGYNWELIEHINNPLGCVRGSDNNLIAQTLSGMYRSTNQGEDWTEICGPSSAYDTRFWVRGLEIFAISGDGLLYYNPTSTPGYTNFKINISPNPLRLFTDGCNIPTGVINVSTDACATRLMEVNVVGSPEFTFTGLSTLPAPMNSSAQVPIVYQPVGADVDSATIHLRIDVGGITFDTFVKVYGRTTPILTPSVTPRDVALSMSPIDCKIDEKKVTILNEGCDPFTIDSMRLSDPRHFSITGLALPMVVPGQGSQVFNVQSNSTSVAKAEASLMLYVSNSAGSQVLNVSLVLRRVGPMLRPMEDKRFTFNTSCEPITNSVEFTNLTCDTIIVDSVKLSNTAQYRLLPLSLPRVLARDQSITIPFEVYAPRPGPSSSRVIVYMRTLGLPTQQISYLSASTTVKLVLPADTVQFIAAGLCPDFDSTFGITNILCDAIRILELKPLFQPNFDITLPQTPLELGPNGFVEIGVGTKTFFKGTSRTSIMMRYEAYGVIYDTIIHVAVRSQNSFTIDPRLQKVNFGRISVCAPQKRTIYIDNRYCIPVTIDRLALSSASSGSYSILYQPVAQRLLAPGERDSVVLQFAPDAIGTRTGAVEVRLKSAIVSLDTFFTVEGIGTGSVNANIRDEQLDLGTALACQRLEQTTVVRNDGCVGLTITSVTPNSGKFALATPSLPHSIAPGDSVTLTFEVLTTQVGAHNETAIVRLVSDQNVEQLLECALSATLTQEAKRVLVPELSLGKLDGCKPHDSTIMVRNPLLCDPIEVTAEFVSANATIIGMDQAIIPPNRFFVFAFRLQPDVQGSIELRLRSPEFDTTIPIYYQYTGGASGEITLSGPSQTLKTNACDIVYDTVVLTAEMCHGAMIDDIRIVPNGGPATRFSLVNAYGFPIQLSSIDKLPIPVRFDPTATGTNAARIEVHTEGLIKTFDLAGEFVPVGSIGAEITSAGLKAVVVGEEFDIDLEIDASISQPVAINDLLAELEFDSDLLTLTHVQPQGNFSLVSENAISGGTKLTFSHPASTFGNDVQLARLTFRTAVAKDKSGTIMLKGISINSGDPRFNDCIASTVFHETSNDATVTYFCGAETLHDALNGKLPLSNIAVQPHPASAADRTIRVSFNSAVEMDVNIELVNVLGATTSSIQMNAHTGRNEIQLPIDGAGKGWHLLRLKTALGNAGIRVMLTD